MKETVKSLTKKHKKKVVGASITGVLVTVLTFWGQIYPVICPLLNLNHQEVCIKLSAAAVNAAKRLDNNAGEIVLDADASLDGGVHE